MGKIYVGDVGTVLKLDTKVDISDCSVFKIRYQKPDGTSDYWTAVRVGQKVRVISDANTWDQSGNWLYQSYVEEGSNKWHGEVISHRIYEVL